MKWKFLMLSVLFVLKNGVDSRFWNRMKLSGSVIVMVRIVMMI